MMEKGIRVELEIKELTPELAEDYLNFFDITPHDDGIDEHKCYCVCWCGMDQRAVDHSTVEKRRKAAGEYVRSGKIQGYLAYADGKAVGWCNANTKADCRFCESWLRFMREAPADEPGLKVKSVFCFVVAPEMQRKGVATRLLERVCADAEAQGFDLVEAYPKKTFIDPAQNFNGPAAMYEKAGFTVYKEINGDAVIMRKFINQ